MKKTKQYKYVKFPIDIIKEVSSLIKNQPNKKFETDYLKIEFDSESWLYDDEDEFLSSYSRLETSYASYQCSNGIIFSLSFYEKEFTEIEVTANTRNQIDKIFNIFEANYPKYKLSDDVIDRLNKQKITIFIGHGKSNQWNDLKDHLHDKHNYDVEAFETGARAGYTIVEILEDMKNNASFALLVHTAEDEDSSSNFHARENVIHETGLFQGKLGFKRAIILLEEDCNEYGNIQGIHQIRFRKDNIKETYGEILATIKREFGN